jgi:hypothetical protein
LLFANQVENAAVCEDPKEKNLMKKKIIAV